MEKADDFRERAPRFDDVDKNESLVQRIINKITDSIVAGELKPGDKLPTEMELIAAFGVSRNTVREAIRTLIAYGVVEIRRPEGTFICDGFSNKMINPTSTGSYSRRRTPIRTCSVSDRSSSPASTTSSSPRDSPTRRSKTWSR